MYIAIQNDRAFATFDNSSVREDWARLYPTCQALLFLSDGANVPVLADEIPLPPEEEEIRTPNRTITRREQRYAPVPAKTKAELIALGAVVIEELPADPLLATRQKMIATVYSLAKWKLNNAVESYSPAEIAVWNQLDNEARQFQLDGTVGKRMQKQVDRGVRTAAEIATAVINNATTLEAYRAAVIEYRHALVEQIKASANPASIDINAGWPVMSA